MDGTGERERKAIQTIRNGICFFWGVPSNGGVAICHIPSGGLGAVARQAISRGLFETGCRPCVKRRQAVSGQRGSPERWQKSTGVARRENR